MLILLATNVFYVKFFLPLRPDLQKAELMPESEPFTSNMPKQDYSTFKDDMETSKDM